MAVRDPLNRSVRGLSVEASGRPDRDAGGRDRGAHQGPGSEPEGDLPARPVPARDPVSVRHDPLTGPAPGAEPADRETGPVGDRVADGVAGGRERKTSTGVSPFAWQQGPQAGLRFETRSDPPLARGWI